MLDVYDIFEVAISLQSLEFYFALIFRGKHHHDLR